MEFFPLTRSRSHALTELVALPLSRSPALTASVELDAGSLDHLGPHRYFALNVLGERLGRAADDLPTQGPEPRISHGKVTLTSFIWTTRIAERD